ncbi:MAG: FG-GAP repeat protein [Candidatus Sulfotelmatobacter sp.]
MLVLFLVPATAQFETRSTVPTSRFPESVAIGDFNRDGKPDLVVAAYFQSDQIAVFLGNGTEHSKHRSATLREPALIRLPRLTSTGTANSI